MIFFDELATSLLAATSHFLMDGTLKPVKNLKYEQLIIISGAYITFQNIFMRYFLAVIETDSKQKFCCKTQL